MILSADQQVLAAQLFKKREQPTDGYTIIGNNAKTRAIGQLFKRNGLLDMTQDSVVLLPTFFDQMQLNGIVDEDGEITELGNELSQRVIEESYRLFKAIVSASSV